MDLKNYNDAYAIIRKQINLWADQERSEYRKGHFWFARELKTKQEAANHIITLLYASTKNGGKRNESKNRVFHKAQELHEPEKD